MAAYKQLKPVPVNSKGADPSFRDIEAHAMDPGTPSRRSTLEDLQIENAETLDLDEDVYGAVFFTLTRDVCEIVSMDKDGLDSKEIYQRYHSEIFRNGAFQKDRWEAWEWEAQQQLCGIAFGKYWFLYAVLSLWWIAIINEVRNIFMLKDKIMGLPHADLAIDMLHRATGDDGQELNFVWRLTPVIRIILYSVLFLPKLAIAAGLGIVGTMWLTATDSFENLVLNSVALTFVTQVDELMFNGLIPITMKKNIRITKLVKSADLEDRAHEAIVKAAYRDATVQVAIVLGGVWIYLSPFGQSWPLVGIFPGYASDQALACQDLWARQRLRVCLRGKECFPIS